MKNSKNNTQLPQTAVKSLFFAQYWGQDVCQTKGGRYKVDEECFPLWKKSYLELKPLSKISDEEVKELGKMLNVSDDDVIGIIISDEFLNTMTNVKNNGVVNLHAIDYLRSKGYAIPFMEYSVEDLVSFGWVRLG